MCICPDLVQFLTEIGDNGRIDIVEAFEQQRRKLHDQQIEERVIHMLKTEQYFVPFPHVFLSDLRSLFQIFIGFL